MNIENMSLIDDEEQILTVPENIECLHANTPNEGIIHITLFAELAALSSTKDKKDLLRTANKHELKIIQYALNTYKKFNVTSNNIFETQKHHKFFQTTEKELDEMFQLLDWLESKTFTGNDALNKINQVMKWKSQELRNIFGMILDKDLCCKIGYKTVNQVFPDFIPSFECMLAEHDMSRVKFPCYLQKKLNGVRTLLIKENGKISLIGRSGIPFYNFKEIEKSAEILLRHHDNIVLDGEIFGMTLAQIMQIARRVHDVDENIPEHQYGVWDMIKLNAFRSGQVPEPWLLRNNRISNMFITCSEKISNIFHIESHKVYNMEEVDQYFNEYVASGGEGVMLKNPDGIYECKRSHNWIKYKKWESSEFEIVGFVKHKKENTLGALVCQMPNGKTFNVGTGFTSVKSDDPEKDRKYIWEHQELFLHKMAEIKYHEKSKNTVSLPVFIRVRWDI